MIFHFFVEMVLDIPDITCIDMFSQGFVISDWQGIDRVTSPPHANYSSSVQAGVDAGIDMVSQTLL
jgi:hypothetical protein